MSTQHYTGLTDLEVIESRKKFGANVLTPPEKETFWDVMKDVLKHWISISIAALTIGSAIFAVVSGNYYIMPAVFGVAWLLITIVGFFGGFEDPLFKILITAFVLSMGISVYEMKSMERVCQHSLSRLASSSRCCWRRAWRFSWSAKTRRPSNLSTKSMTERLSKW